MIAGTVVLLVVLALPTLRDLAETLRGAKKRSS